MPGSRNFGRRKSHKNQSASIVGTGSNTNDFCSWDQQKENARPRKNTNYMEFKLEPDSELRFEVENKNVVILEMKQGLAEIFGREIILGIKYDFYNGAKIAVFTWHGCILHLHGTPEYSYTSKETPAIQYLNIHSCLEDKRNDAERENMCGPIVMIVGAPDVGKSTLARLLLNYAVRTKHRKPIFVDLDVAENQLSLPGSVSAVMVERPIPFEGNFSEDTALVYHYGYTNITSNHTLYDMVVSRLANVVDEKMMKQDQTKTSGVIINTTGYNRTDGYNYLVHIVKEFKVDIILVLDSESLQHFLMKQTYNKDVDVVLLPKNGGVVQRNEQLRYEARDSSIRSYFYGRLNDAIHPHGFQVKFSEVHIYKVGALTLPDSCMPVGVLAEDNRTKLVRVEPSPNLLHHLFAMSYSSNPDEIVTANVVGFITVTNVDMELQMMLILSPHPRPLPRKVLLLSEVQFYDN